VVAVTNQTRLSVYLDPQLIKDIKVFAAQNGLTLSSVAEKAFKKLLQESGKNSPM
jgi:hypothetical protein